MRAGRPSAAASLTAGFLVLGVIWGGFLGLRQIDGAGSVLDRVEYLTADLRFELLGARPPPDDVAIVAVDDATLRDAGGFPLPRAALARIIGALAACAPRTLAIDIALLDAGPPAADAALAAALAASPTVIAAIGQFDTDGAPDPAALPHPARVLWATPQLRAAARSGLVNIATDLSGIPRFIPLLYRADAGVLPSFALIAASPGGDPMFGPDAVTLDGRRTALDLGDHLALRYFGPAGSIARISAASLPRGTCDAALRGRTIVLGVTAAGVGDSFATPFDRIVPGVEVLATGIANLRAGDGLIRTPMVRRIDAAAAILLACATVLLMSMRRVFLGLGLATLLLALWTALTFSAFAQGYWLSIAVPFAALAPVALGYGAARLIVDRVVATRLAADKATLTRFQSPRLLKHILANPDFLDTPVRQNLAVVFVDLSGFTGLAESLGPERTRTLLAEFQALIERIVTAHDGYVASFMGDGAMIAFGLPTPRADDAARALQAITELDTALTGWIASLPARDRLSVRIGGHFGLAVASRLGPAHHQHIAATGDTVNVASRLLEVAKQQGASVIVSEDLCAAARAPPAACLDVAIRGRAETLRVRALR